MFKGLLVLLVAIILVPSTTLAAIPPWPAFCEHQGYDFGYDEATDTEYCVFDQKNKCELVSFYEGDCGQEFVKDVRCRVEGERVFSQFEQCCDGLDPYLKGETGQPRCEKISVFKRFWKWLVRIFT